MWGLACLLRGQVESKLGNWRGERFQGHGVKVPCGAGGTEGLHRTSAGVVRDCEELGRGVLVLGVQCYSGKVVLGRGKGWGRYRSGEELIKQGVRKWTGLA